MAEFLNQKVVAAETAGADGFNAFGKPVSMARKEAAYQHCKAMGLTVNAMTCVSGMAEKIERDEPYAAMEVGMRYLDLTGTYRLLAVLCTA